MTTYEWGWCPGCQSLHCTSNCLDDHPEQQEPCPCCEAISADRTIQRERLATWVQSGAGR